MAIPGSGKTFRLSIISPEKKVFEGDVQLAVVPAYDGEVGILHGHAPFMALLGDGQLRIETGTATRLFNVSGGFVQVSDNEVSVVSESAAEA